MSDPNVLFADAHDSMARLTVNPLCARNHAEKLVREDARRVLDTLEPLVVVAEAARAFAAVTLGLENTKEGAALLAALKKLEKTNEQHTV